MVLRADQHWLSARRQDATALLRLRVLRASWRSCAVDRGAYASGVLSGHVLETIGDAPVGRRGHGLEIHAHQSGTTQLRRHLQRVRPAIGRELRPAFVYATALLRCGLLPSLSTVGHGNALALPQFARDDHGVGGHFELELADADERALALADGRVSARARTF